jgi:putative membrane protein
MFYTTYYGGMSLVWWFIWIVALFWIFVTPYNIPGQRYKREAPLDILKKRYAKGEINASEFADKKRILENDHSNYVFIGRMPVIINVNQTTILLIQRWLLPTERLLNLFP